MICMVVASFMMMSVLTPPKMAFLLTLNSIFLAMMSYQTSGSVFCCSSIIVSFSSGMMIILCYTAMMSNFESKNKISINLIVPMTFGAFLVSSKKHMVTNMKESSMMSVNSYMIVILMVMVICSMKAINQSVFSPSKSMISSY